MTTMLITLGVIVTVCSTLGFFADYSRGKDFGEGLGGLAVGMFLGFCSASAVGVFWVALHFLSKVW